MGVWKATVTMRIRPDFKDELVKFAAMEKRSLGNLGGILLEWAFEQLESAGSTDRLLRCKIRPHARRQKGT
jgi:hypothetical protein